MHRIIHVFGKSLGNRQSGAIGYVPNTLFSDTTRRLGDIVEIENWTSMKRPTWGVLAMLEDYVALADWGGFLVTSRERSSTAAEWDSLMKRLGNALFSYRVSERIRAQCCAAKRFDKEAYATHVLPRVRRNHPR